LQFGGVIEDGDPAELFAIKVIRTVGRA